MRSAGNTKGNTATSTKKRGTRPYGPPAQQQHSVRTISREEHWDFCTVAKVLANNRAKLTERHMEQTRAAYCALTPQAVETLKRAMEKGDVRVAHRVLTEMGVVPQPSQIPYAPGLENSETGELTETKKYIAEFVEMAIERAADYGLPPLQLPRNAESK